MRSIGIIGTGFVGTAVFEGMRHAFEVYAYDKCQGPSKSEGVLPQISAEKFGSFWVVENTDGPIFVCVPTPMDVVTGIADTSIVESVVAEIDEAVENSGSPRVVVIKSTVPPGTTCRLDRQFDNVIICFNPEFLRETSSVEDFKKQDRIIIGGDRKGTNVLKQMYETAYPDVPVTKTSSTIAEMVKYTTNCFLAVKVSLANEFKQICDQLEDVDFDKVVEYATKDRRLGTSHWSVPGPDGTLGFGGSCFPKDINALMAAARELGVEPRVMQAAWDKNLEVRPGKDWEKLKGRAVNE